MMFVQCIAVFLCSVGLPVVAVKTVDTVQNAANLENYVVDTASGNWLPVQYSQTQEPKPATTSGTTTAQSNYVVLNPAYLGTDPLRSAILAQSPLDNSILSTNNQPTNSPPVPVQNFVPQTPSTSTPSATLVANTNQEPPKRSGGMTFTVATGPGTSSNFQTFGSPPLIIFAPQDPTPSIITSTAANSGNTGATPIKTPTSTSGTNTVTNPSTSTAPTPAEPTTSPQTSPTTSGNNPLPTPVRTTTSPVETTSTITRNPFGTVVPVTDPTFRPNGLPTLISTIANPISTSNLIPSTAPPALTGQQLTQILSSTKNPPTIFELTGLPLNGGNPNPIGTTTGTGPVGINNPQPEPEPEPQTTTPQGVQPVQSSLKTTTSANQNQPILNPFLTPSVPPFLGSQAPIDPNVISALQPNAVGSGSISSTSTPSTNGVTPSSNTGSNAGAAATAGSTTTGPMTSTIVDLTVTATGTTSSNTPSATSQATTGPLTSGVTLASPGVTTTSTNGITVSSPGTISTTPSIADLASISSTIATAIAVSTPQSVNPIDTILAMVANKQRVPDLQASIDRQIGIFTKYLNGQTAGYQKSIDNLQSLIDQVAARKASFTAALTNIRGLLSGMITRPSQKISLENLLRAATTIQNLKDQVAVAQSEKSIAKIRTLIIEAARVANVKI